jgi:hypothetical protein
VFRRSGLEIWRELHELVLCVPAPHPFDCRWRVSSDERRLVVSFGMQRVGVWSLDDGLFLGWAEADIPRPEPLFNAALLQQVQPTASGALWRGQDGTYLHLGDGPRGWITPLACSADRRMMILPCRSGAALIEFDPEPRLLQVIPFNGRLRASCITATEAMVVNGAGSIVQSPRMDASLDA